MFRWQSVLDFDFEDMTVKMYREPFQASSTVIAPNENIELDHIAHKYLGSELMMYKILDTNWVEYMEARGDVAKMSQIELPLSGEEWASFVNI